MKCSVSQVLSYPQITTACKAARRTASEPPEGQHSREEGCDVTRKFSFAVADVSSPW